MKKYKKLLKNLYIRFKYYHFLDKKGKERTLVFFLKEGYPQPHPGFADRLKAIVGLYYIAKKNDFQFKLSYSTPFPLEEYLQPAQVDWICKENEISFGRRDTKLLMYAPSTQIPFLNPNYSQYHCYYYEGLNLLKTLQKENWEKEWYTLYHELFKPSDRLQHLIEQQKPKENFIAVHIRFVNALDHFEKGYEKNLTKLEQEELIKSCVQSLQKIRNKEQSNIYVFSDSKRFLQIAQEEGFPVLSTENIGHVSFQEEREVYEKMLTDFFVIAEAEKVYFLQGKSLYNSAFSHYASIIGGKPYFVENIDGKE